MIAVNGYYDGNVCILTDKVDVQPYKRVIVTVLDDYAEEERSRARAKSRAGKEAAAKTFDEFCGMWKDREDIADVDGYVRKLREGRKFDI